MRIMLATTGATILGGIGWWLGGYAGIMTAMIVSVFGSAIGWYAGTRIYHQYL